MLKVYRYTVSYHIVTENQKRLVHSYSAYCIDDEETVHDPFVEYNAYEFHGIAVDIRKTWLGRVAVYYNFPSNIKLKEWIDPDAKLVLRITHKPASCSMKELMDLDHEKVIAYLKQEGLTNCQFMV